MAMYQLWLQPAEVLLEKDCRSWLHCVLVEMIDPTPPCCANTTRPCYYRTIRHVVHVHGSFPNLGLTGLVRDLSGL